MIGEIFQSNNCGKMEVLEQVGAKFKVRFEETGSEVISTAHQIRSGSVKDRFYPAVAGVGYLGFATSTSNPKLYARWKRMIQSCYDSFHLDYPSNGGNGIRVADRWHSYENYQEDLIDLLEKSGSPERFRVIRTGLVFNSNNIMIVKQK